MKYDSIGFDLDGTLWDGVVPVTKAWQSAAKELGFHTVTQDDIRGIMGLNREDLMNKLFFELTQKDKDFLFERATQLTIPEVREHGGRLFDNEVETLKRLSESYKLYIVSNCQLGYIEAFFDYYKEISKLFSDSENAAKTSLSKGENIKLVIKRNGFTSSVYIGDTYGDYSSAQAAGVDFVFAEYGFGNVVDTKHKISSFKDILNVLE